MKRFSEIMLLLLISELCSSCHFGSPEPNTYSAIIYYRNAQGQDLLDPGTVGHYDNNGLAIKWSNPDGTIGTSVPIVLKQSTINPAIPYLPNGYWFSVDPSLIKDNNGNNGIVHGSTCVILIQLNKSVTDTITFVYSGSTLQNFLYNKKTVSPPTPMTSYPPAFPVIMIK